MPLIESSARNMEKIVSDKYSRCGRILQKLLYDRPIKYGFPILLQAIVLSEPNNIRGLSFTCSTYIVNTDIPARFGDSGFHLQLALFAPLYVFSRLLLDRGLILFLAQADGHEGVVGAVLSLDVQAAGLLDCKRRPSLSRVFSHRWNYRILTKNLDVCWTPHSDALLSKVQKGPAKD